MTDPFNDDAGYDPFMDDDTSPLPEARSGTRFGRCPDCDNTSDDEHECRNIGREHWFFCTEHKTKWCAGENLMSSYQHETEFTYLKNVEFLSDYRERIA